MTMATITCNTTLVHHPTTTRAEVVGRVVVEGVEVEATRTHVSSTLAQLPTRITSSNWVATQLAVVTSRARDRDSIASRVGIVSRVGIASRTVL